MDNKYLDNLRGSPYINEAGLNPINKIKTGVSNFVNKFKNGSTAQQPVNKPAAPIAAINKNPNAALTPTVKPNLNTGISEESKTNFLKIVEKVCEMINKKIESDPSEVSKPPIETPSPEQNLNKFVGSGPTYKNQLNKYKADAEAEYAKKIKASYSPTGKKTGKKLDEADESKSRNTTTLNVANNEAKAGGWLNWFQGHYNKSRKFGLDLNIEDRVELSGGKIKKLRIKWSNSSHENRIIVMWENDNKFYDKRSLSVKPPQIKNKPPTQGGVYDVSLQEAIDEADVKSHDVNRGEFCIFMFFDDQIIPSSPSYKNPTIGMLLHQANPRSNLVSAVMSNPELENKSPRLIGNLYHVVEKKWKEFKGHKRDNELNIEKKDGKLLLNGKEIKLNDVLAGLILR